MIYVFYFILFYFIFIFLNFKNKNKLFSYRFDAPVILYHIKKNGLLETFCNYVYGFADTLLIFKNVLRTRYEEKKSFKQETLAYEYLGPDSIEGAHDALKDIEILEKLTQKFSVSVDLIRDKARSMEKTLILENEKVLRNKNKPSLKILNTEYQVSDSMLSKVASAGINLKNLVDAYEKSKSNGIKILLCQDVNGHPRVTNHTSSITSITTAVKNFCEKNQTQNDC